MTGKIPNFEDCPITDESGMLTPIWKNILAGTISFLQQNHSQEGLVLPQQSTANIGTLATIQSVGATVYDNVLNQFDMCLQTGPKTAEFRTVTLSKPSDDKIQIYWDSQNYQYTTTQNGYDIALSQNIISTGNQITVDLNNYPLIDIEVPNLNGVTGPVQTQLNDISALCVTTWPTQLTFNTGVLSITPGYYFPTTTDDTNWNTAYNEAVATWPDPLVFNSGVLTINPAYYFPLIGDKSDWDTAYNDAVFSWPDPLVFSLNVLTINPLYYFPLVTDETNWNTAYTESVSTWPAFLNFNNHVISLNPGYYIPSQIAGGVPSSYTVNPSPPSTNLNNVYAVSAVSEPFTISAIALPSSYPTYVYPVYTINSGIWNVIATNSMPYYFIFTGPSTTVIAYNNSGSMNPVNYGYYCNWYLVYTNLGFAFVPGNNQFTTLALAQAEKPQNFNMSGFPATIFYWGYQFTYFCQNTFIVDGQCCVAANPESISYYYPTVLDEGNWNLAYTYSVNTWPSPLSFSDHVITVTSGYYFPTTTDETNWNTAYTDRIATFTTTGSSGSASFSGNTLNIPTYTLSGLNGQPLNTNLTSLSGLTYSSTSFVKMTGSGAFGLDTTSYQPAYNFTLSGTAAQTYTFPTSTCTLAANNQTFYIGTTSIAINRTSASQSLTGITSIDGYAAQLTTTNSISASTFYVPFISGSTTGQYSYDVSSGLSYVPSTATLTATTFSGALSGNATTASSAAKWTTARNLAGNSVDGSANVAFSNKFIVQGTTDAGLSGAQFLGALGTGIVKNTTTTGVLSIAVASDFPTLNQNTTGTATYATNIAGGVANNIPYQTGIGTTSFITPAASSVLVSNASSVPSWQTITSLVDQRWIDIVRQGFVNNAQTSLSFNASTYVLTLTDAGSGWQYMWEGILYSISGNVTLTLSGSPPAAQTYFIYIDNGTGTLGVMNTPYTLTDTKVPVAIIYYNHALTPTYWLSDERHQCLIDSRQHYYEHFTLGTRYLNGGLPSGYVVAPVSPTDANNCFAISQAQIADEDLIITCPALSQPSGSSPAYEVWYRTGASTWLWQENDVPFNYTTSGYINWDNNGTMTQGSSANYYNSYLIYTHITGVSCFMIVNGRGEYGSLAAAQAENVATFNLAAIGILEAVIAYQFTWHSLAGYSTLGKVRLAATPVQLNISFIATGSGGAITNAISVTLSNDTTSNASMNLIWATGTSGQYPLFTSSSGLTFNPSTGILTSIFSGNLTGNVTGNASTATTSTTATNANNINITDLPISSSTPYYPVMVNSNTGDLAPYTCLNGIYFTPNAGLSLTGQITAKSANIALGITCTILIGNVTGNCSGSSGSCTGNSATVTGLSIVSGKTLTANNSITLAGTDGTTMTFPGTSKTIMASDYSNAGTAPTWNQSTTGNAATATTATTATNVTATATTTNAAFYIPFVSGSTTGNYGLDIYSDLNYNPSTKTLSATTFNGAFSGTVTNATNIATTATTSNTTYYLPLITGTTTGNYPPYVGSGLTFNPNTNKISTTLLGLSGTTDASSSTTGTGIISGGLGVAKSIIAGTSITAGYNGVGTGLFVCDNDTSSGGAGHLQMNAGGYQSWVIGLINSKTGSNVGADWMLFNFSDTGTYLGNPLLITRATGAVNLNAGIASISNTSGTLVVNGGIGLSGNVHLGGSVAAQTQYYCNQGNASGAGAGHYVLQTIAGVSRWSIGLVDPETGSNAGSDLCFFSYADGGLYLATPIYFTRSTGVANFNAGITLPTTGGTAAVMSGAERYSFSSTFTGCGVTTVSVTFTIIKTTIGSGGQITITQTSSASTLQTTTTTGGAFYANTLMPARFCPVQTTDGWYVGSYNGGVFVGGLQIAPNGQIILSGINYGVIGAAPNTGWYAFTVSYAV